MTPLFQLESPPSLVPIYYSWNEGRFIDDCMTIPSIKITKIIPKWKNLRTSTTFIPEEVEIKHISWLIMILSFWAL
jgi:hypothetical protein